MGGGLGAKAMAEYLEAQGVQLEFVLDEGGPLLVDGLQPFIKDKAVALVGTAEKVHCLLYCCFHDMHSSPWSLPYPREKACILLVPCL